MLTAARATLVPECKACAMWKDPLGHTNVLAWGVPQRQLVVLRLQNRICCRIPGGPVYPLAMVLSPARDVDDTGDITVGSSVQQHDVTTFAVACAESFNAPHYQHGGRSFTTAVRHDKGCVANGHSHKSKQLRLDLAAKEVHGTEGVHRGRRPMHSHQRSLSKPTECAAPRTSKGVVTIWLSTTFTRMLITI